MKTFNNFDLHFNFGRKNDSICFVNAEYIHPLKQDLLQELQADFEKNQNVKAVIVFGSGVEFRCNSYSDLGLLKKESSCMTEREFMCDIRLFKRAWLDYKAAERLRTGRRFRVELLLSDL